MISTLAWIIIGILVCTNAATLVIAVVLASRDAEAEFRNGYAEGYQAKAHGYPPPEWGDVYHTPPPRLLPWTRAGRAARNGGPP